MNVKEKVIFIAAVFLLLMLGAVLWRCSVRRPKEELEGWDGRPWTESVESWKFRK